MKKMFFIAFVLAGLFFLAACIDPSEAVLKKGRNIDIERMTGTVTAKYVKYFEEGEEQGQPYYGLTVNYEEKGVKRVEDFIGVPPEIFDSVEVGATLPVIPFITEKQLEKVEGVVLDKQANLETKRWFIAVDNNEMVRVYRIDKDLYYKKIRVETRLPLSAAE